MVTFQFTEVLSKNVLLSNRLWIFVLSLANLVFLVQLVFLISTVKISRNTILILTAVAAFMLLAPRFFGSLLLTTTRLATSSMAVAKTAYTPGLFSVAYVTAPKEEVAKQLARGIIEKKLAACVNIIPQITSVYSWKDKIEEDSEVLMIIKTRTSVVPVLSKFIRENHPYEVAEVIAAPIEDGNPPYLDWLIKSVPEEIASVE